MSARDKLYGLVIHEEWLTNEEVDEAIDAFAHELAEEIRNSEVLRDFTDDHMGDCNAAADLIDPEVS